MIFSHWCPKFLNSRGKDEILFFLLFRFWLCVYFNLFFLFIFYHSDEVSDSTTNKHSFRALHNGVFNHFIKSNIVLSQLFHSSLLRTTTIGMVNGGIQRLIDLLQTEVHSLLILNHYQLIIYNGTNLKENKEKYINSIKMFFTYMVRYHTRMKLTTK